MALAVLFHPLLRRRLFDTISWTMLDVRADNKMSQIVASFCVPNNGISCKFIASSAVHLVEIQRFKSRLAW